MSEFDSSGIGVLEYGCSGGLCSISGVLQIRADRAGVDEDMHYVWEVLQPNRRRRGHLDSDDPLHAHPLRHLGFQPLSTVWRQREGKWEMVERTTLDINMSLCFLSEKK